MTRLAPWAALAALVAACGSSTPPPRRAAPPPPKPVTTADDDLDKPKAPESIYVYSPVGKRDPFMSIALSAGVTAAESSRGRTKTPLEKWPLDKLKVAMTVTGTATPLAMLEDPEQRGWAVRLGDFVGTNGGRVTAIHRDEVVITETITDHSTGRVYPQVVKLAVPVSKDEQADLAHLREGEQLQAAKGER